MPARNKKKSKRFNLLKMTALERIQFIKEIREKLQHKTIEAKVWQSLLEVENLTVNGSIVFKENQQLSGFYLRNRI